MSVWTVTWNVNFTTHGCHETVQIKLPRKDHRKGKEAITRTKEGIKDEPSRLRQARTIDDSYRFCGTNVLPNRASVLNKIYIL